MLVKSASVAMLMAIALPVVSAGSVQPDFGLCNPAIEFEGGLGGRPATEFTFLPADPLIAQGQQEALNPNIITNRICDQLTNVCEANDAAKVLCRDAQAQIQALDTRDQTTADTWNELISGGTAAGAQELKRRSEKRIARRQVEFKACSTDLWIDDCTGWPRKRDEQESAAAPVKRSESVENANAKRQVAFKACSTDAWIDDCTGWP